MHRIIRILLVIFIFWLCLACHLKAQDKPRFDLPPKIKAAIADTVTIKKNIAELDSLIKSLQVDKKNQVGKLKILRRLAK